MEAEPPLIEAPFCRRCGAPDPKHHAADLLSVCADCGTQAWHFDWARSACKTGDVLDAVVGFKYADQYYQRARLVRWLTAAFDQHAALDQWDGLVPVPLYHTRFRERGFNQADEIARGLAKNRKLTVYNCLYRYRQTVSQVTLKRKARLENMAGAFKLKRGFDVTGRHLLLIDDVFTTGATVNACAQVLANAGAARLAVLTVARS